MNREQATPQKTHFHIHWVKTDRLDRKDSTATTRRCRVHYNSCSRAMCLRLKRFLSRAACARQKTRHANPKSIPPKLNPLNIRLKQLSSSPSSVP